MQQKNNIFFIKKNEIFIFFAIPLFIISLISLGVLIATLWYQIDYQIAVELAKHLYQMNLLNIESVFMIN